MPMPTDIVKAEADDREYEYLVLPNGLRCVLISDKEADKAAACMDCLLYTSPSPRD